MDDSRDPVEVLAEEFLERRRRGEDVSIDSFAEEYPEYAEKIRELFPVLLFMETQSMGAEGVDLGPAPPEEFGPYRILEELGHGGMGRVFLAHNTKLDRKDALKLLPEQFADDEMRAGMFKREAMTAANLNHPHIATVYDADVLEGRHYIAMEYVQGQPLSEVLRERGALPLEDLLPIAIQIAEGICAAHAHRIIHRDLKPGNIMLSEDGVAKILDFGLAKVLGSESGEKASSALPMHTTGAFIGTVGYMSPEQARGKVVEASTDLFSFGVILYEMATGKRPFHKETTADSLSALLKEDPPRVTELNPRLPVGLERLIGGLLEKRAEDRPESAEVVLAGLRELVPGRVSGTRKFLRVAMGVAALVIAGVALVWVVGGGAQADDLRPDRARLLIERGKLDQAEAIIEDLRGERGEGD
ncbi:MAG: serine/threonine-protein kinase, partial [Planctomycetota bacterium]